MAIEDNRSGDQAIPERFFAETSIALRSGKSKAIKLAIKLGFDTGCKDRNPLNQRWR